MTEFSELDLRDALSGFRPDPAAFRRSFERGVIARTRDGGGLRRSAAAVAPIGVLERLETVVAGKALGLALALPVLAVAMLGISFVSALRAALRVGSDRPRAARLGARRTLLYVSALGAAVALLASARGEVLVFVFAASMTYVGARLDRLAARGLVTRRAVGEFCASFLGALLVLALLAKGATPPAHTVPAFWAPFALLVGSVACDVAGRFPDARSTLRRIRLVAMPALVLAAIGSLLHARIRPLTTPDLVAFVERFERPLDDVVAWGRFGVVVEHLAASGTRPLDLRRAERAVAARWPDGLPAAPTSEERYAALGAARAGVLPEEAYRALAQSPHSAELREGTHPINGLRALELELRASSRNGLDASARASLVARLRAAWPEPGDAHALEDMAGIARMLDLLGAPLAASGGELERLGVSARRALELAFLGEAQGVLAGAFAPDAATASSPPSEVLLVPPTRAAVELIERFGAPSAVDVAALAAFLERRATPSLVEAFSPKAARMLTVQDHRFEAAVAAARLRASEHGRPPRRAGGARLASEAVLAGALLLVLVCAVATVRAPAAPIATIAAERRD